MTKKELQEIIIIAVRTVVQKEIKPLIELTIRKEFNKILDEAESAKFTAKPSKTLMIDNIEPQETSLVNLVEQDKESDPARAEINERIFKGKTPFKEKNPFAEVLNQTATEVGTRTGIYANPMKQTSVGEQKKVVLNQPMVESASPVVEGALTPPLREGLVIMGDIEKIGSVDGMPETGGSVKPKSNILAKDLAEVSQPIEVELPTMSAGGEVGVPKPIDYSKVPIKLAQNMMKNYSGLMKKVDTKVRRPE